MSTVSRLDLTTAVDARLRTIAWLHVYLGEAGDVPLLRDTNGDVDPSGRVAAYAVLYPFAGTPDTDDDLGATSTALSWGGQVTVAAGHTNDVLDAVDAVHTALYRWRPTDLPNGVITDGLVPPPGYEPGPIQRSRTGAPRFWLPLQYRLTATT